MALPPTLHERYLKRFDELIAEGEMIIQGTTTETEPGLQTTSGLVALPPTVSHSIDVDRFYEWQAKWVSLLSQIVPGNHPQAKRVARFRSYAANYDSLRQMLALLRAMKDDYQHGFLDDLPSLIRAEIAGDSLAQAEMLYEEGYYVPAGVLAAAVFEDVLRKLCDEKGIPTINGKGRRKTINPMNGDLAKAKVYNAAKAHEIRAWADIRNDCAHGDGDKVNPQDVGRMVKGVRAFVADHLR